MEKAKPDLEHGIYRVTHFLVLGELRYLAESDLIFLDDKPFAVLEWAGPRDNQEPELTVALEPTRLQVAYGEAGYFVYDGDVLDPRKVH